MNTDSTTPADQGPALKDGATVAVIGGGIAGLSCAYYLARNAADTGRKIKIIHLEKQGRWGGNIMTETDEISGMDGLSSAKGNHRFLIEAGPDCFLSEKAWALKLASELGMENEFLGTNDKFRKTYIYSGGKMHLMPEGVMLMVPTKIWPMASSTLFSMAGKIRMGYELFVPKRTDGKDESLEEFVTRRLGRELLDKLAEPLVAGIHAGDPATMSVKSSFPRFIDMEQNHGSMIRAMLSAKRKMAAMKQPESQAEPKKTMFMTFLHGLGRITEELLEKTDSFGVDIDRRADAAVRSVSRDPSGAYRIALESGGDFLADAAAVAVPSYTAAKMLESISGGKLSEALLKIPYVSTATVTLVFDREKLDHPLDGFGFIVPKVENRKIMAATWTSTKFSHRTPSDKYAMIRVFLGGAQHRDMVFLPDEEMVATVLAELKIVMGLKQIPSPLISRVYKWVDAMPQYVVGHKDNLGKIDTLAGTNPGLYLLGSAYRGIGINDIIASSHKLAGELVPVTKGN